MSTAELRSAIEAKAGVAIPQVVLNSWTNKQRAHAFGWANTTRKRQTPTEVMRWIILARRVA